MAEATKEQSKAMLGTSMVGTNAIKDYTQAKYLLIVPGHAVYVGREASHSSLDEHWKGGFNGEAKYYTEHALAGVNQAGNNSKYLLVFSGGQTREPAGPISEAQSYWFLSDQFNWNNLDGVKGRALVEDFARDSFENLAFGVGTFARVTNQMPIDIILFGWGFKEERYRMHADALQLRQHNLHYIRVNMPEGSETDVSSPLGSALKGEKKTIADFAASPFGMDGILHQKRLQRDPWLRGESAYLFYNIKELFPFLRKQ